MDLHDTIVAIASAAGSAPRGVVRLSGPRALEVARALAGSSWPARIDRPTVVDAPAELTGGRSLPARWFVWPGERSYTRQPTVEIHTLGSPPLLDLLVRLACTQGGRLANPGEFTLRAFLAGRLDLTQAEAVLGVIDAHSDAQLKTALGQLAGGLAGPIALLREELLLLLADLEAGLDFADEDIEFISAADLAARLALADRHLESLQQQVQGRRIGDRPPRVVLAGATNAGKSSLFNALVRRFGRGQPAPQAIESSQAGTTRDYLTATVTLGDVECELVDTAGTEHVVEVSPRQRAQRQSSVVRAQADLVLRCVDSTSALESSSDLSDDELLVLTKVDAPGTQPPACLATSALTGTGLDELARAVAQRLAERPVEGMVASTAQRSSESLRRAHSAVGEALKLVGQSEELVASELRIALNELGQIAGVVYTDDVLDRVFSRFCIGK